MRVKFQFFAKQFMFLLPTQTRHEVVGYASLFSFCNIYVRPQIFVRSSSFLVLSANLTMTRQTTLTLLFLLISSATATWTRGEDPYRPVNSDWEGSIPRVQGQQQQQRQQAPLATATIWDIRLPLIHSGDIHGLRGSKNNHN